MRLALLLCAALVGCQSVPVVPPRNVVVFCVLPDKHTEAVGVPVKPSGDYSQKDVAVFIFELHRAARLLDTQRQAARQWSRECESRAAEQRDNNKGAE